MIVCADPCGGHVCMSERVSEMVAKRSVEMPDGVEIKVYIGCECMHDSYFCVVFTYGQAHSP